MSQPRCSVFVAISLDGFIANSVQEPSWLELAHHQDGEDYGYAEFIESVDTVILDESAYKQALKFPLWPFKNKKVFVKTEQLMTSSKHREKPFTGLLKNLLQQLGSETPRHIYFNGAEIIQEGLEQKLVNDLTLSIFPLLVGHGAALFGPLGQHLNLQISSALSYPSGLVQLTYRLDPEQAQQSPEAQTNRIFHPTPPRTSPQNDQLLDGP